MRSSSSQSAFARALVDPDHPLPPGLAAWNGSDPERRFAVYRNNIVVSLIAALVARFPVVRELVGDAFFHAMARHFALRHPPRSRLMLAYGDAFPVFIAGFEPASALPYLADVAALEAARTSAYHAADAPALGPAEFGGVDPDALFAMTVQLHPSARILVSHFAIFSLWAAHQQALAIAGVDPSTPEDVLVVRPLLDVEVTRLLPGGAVFITRLSAGASLGAAATAAIAAAAEFNLTAALHVLVATGVVTRLTPCRGERP